MKLARKSLSIFVSGCTTLATGFLSLVGAYTLWPSFLFAGAAFILSGAFEGEVNRRAIKTALRRIFDENYLKRGLLRQYLEERYKTNKADPFLEDYMATLTRYKYLTYLKDEDQLEKKEKIERSLLKRRLVMMEQVALRLFEKPTTDSGNAIDKQVKTGLGAEGCPERVALETKMRHRKYLIRAVWPFVLGGGGLVGLATLSALKVGIAAFAFLSVTPGGILIAVAAVAAMGYTLLLYQTFTDMIQRCHKKWFGYFNKAEDESRAAHVFRCTCVILATTVAVFATILSAGTFWYAAKNGAALLAIGEKAADIIRNVFLSLASLPALLFNAVNSIDLAVKSFKSNDGFSQIKNSIKEPFVDASIAWKKENIVQWLNPFRLADNIISIVARPLLFVGHVISVGLMATRLESIPSSVCVTGAAVGELLPDLNYLTKHSLLLKILFFPVKVAVETCKFFSTGWDSLFSDNCIEESREKMQFMMKPTYKLLPAAEIPASPVLSDAWQKQEVINSCDQVMERLGPSSKEKYAAATKLKLAFQNELVSDSDELKAARKSLSTHRYSLWSQSPTKSGKEIGDVVDHYFEPRKSAAGG